MSILTSLDFNSGFILSTCLNVCDCLSNSILAEPNSPINLFFFTSNTFFPSKYCKIITLSASCVAFAVPKTEDMLNTESSASFLG